METTEFNRSGVALMGWNYNGQDLNTVYFNGNVVFRKRNNPYQGKHITITITNPILQSEYDIDDLIYFKINIVSDGTETFDAFNIEWERSGDFWSIDNKQSGQTTEIGSNNDCYYQITETDILAWADGVGISIENELILTDNATGNVLDSSLYTIIDNWTPTVTLADPNPNMEIIVTEISSPVDGIAYNLGERIRYTISITNNGNLGLTNVSLTEATDMNAWTVLSAPVGYNRSFSGQHTITEDDIINGLVTIYPEINADTPYKEQPEITIEETYDFENIAEPYPKLSIEQRVTSTPSSGDTYEVGDTINYEIYVTNIGNLTLFNMFIEDEFTGDSWTSFAGRESISPGETWPFATSHRVTEYDAISGTVINVATAYGEDIQGNSDEVSSEISVDVKTQYTLTVNYYTQNLDNTFTKQTASTFTNVYNYGEYYTVTSPNSSGVFTGRTPDQARVTGQITADTTIDVYYTLIPYILTINYLFTDGTTAYSPSYNQTYYYEQSYSVTSPTISGYTPNTDIVSGNMPARDVIVTVVYI